MSYPFLGRVQHPEVTVQIGDTLREDIVFTHHFSQGWSLLLPFPLFLFPIIVPSLLFTSSLYPTQIIDFSEVLSNIYDVWAGLFLWEFGEGKSFLRQSRKMKKEK